MVGFQFDDEFAGMVDFARMYRSLSLSPVPARGKQPVVAWMALQGGLTPQDTFDRWFGRPDGQYILTMEIGLLTGAASDGLFVVDLDVKHGPDAMQWWQTLLTTYNSGLDIQTPTIRTPSGGLHIWFKAPQGYRAPTIRTDLGVDIRGEGGFIVTPPSYNYKFLPDLEPWVVDIAEAPDWLIVAIAALSPPHGHHVERTPSSADVSPLGVVQDGREAMMRDIVWAVLCDLRRKYPGDNDSVPLPELQAEHDRAWAKYELQAKSRIPSENGTSNADRLEREGRGITAFNEKWASAAAQWDDKLKVAAAQRPFPVTETTPVFDPWEPYIVPVFPFNVLPAPVRAYVEYLALSVGVDPSAAAMAVLAVAGAALTQESQLRMRQTGSFTARPRLWVAMVGDPAAKKSPLIRAAVAPIRAFEERHYKQWKRDHAQWKRDGEDAGSEPREPAQVLFKDTTVEALAIELERHARGALVVHDELAGFVGGLEKYGQSRGAFERAFYNEAYNGGWYKANRATRAKLEIENLCIGMIGAIQPERVNEIAGLTTDGLMQRFCPVMMRNGQRSQEVPDDTAAQDWDRQVCFLLGMQRQTYLLGEVGRSLLSMLEDEAEETMQSDDLPGGFRGWAGKAPGVYGSLAMILHVLGSKDPVYDTEVGETAARGALAILRFLISHALAFYDGDGGDPFKLYDVAAYLLTSDVERVLLSDVTRNVRSWRGLDRKTFVQRMSILVGWDVVTETGTVTQPAWIVNPAWREGLAQRRAALRDRRAATRQFLLALRKSPNNDEN